MSRVKEIILKHLIQKHEGTVKKNNRHVVYKDSLGIETIGYGRNIKDNGLSDEEAEYLLLNDIKDVLFSLMRLYPWYIHLSQNRQFALADMAFNMGIPRLQKFKKMLIALEAHDYETAAQEALDSKWAKQVGGRANEIVNMILDG